MLTYDFYNMIYKGYKLKDDNKFHNLAEKAKSQIDYYTFGRLKNVTDAETLYLVNLTMCELIDNQSDFELLGNIKSKSQGSRSVTYETPQNGEAKQYDIISRRLAHTGLLYRGVNYVQR